MYDVAALYKDGPSAGDVHVNSVGDGKSSVENLYLPSQERSAKDIDDERIANLERYPGDVAKAFSTFFKVSGVDSDLGIVFGWGIVCKENGADYTDTQGNHIPENAMLKAVSDFMAGDRMAGEQHERMDAGTVVHSFPLTSEIAKAMGITSAKTGWMIAMKPDAALLAKFASGEMTGFSIGGEHVELDGKPVGVS